MKISRKLFFLTVLLIVVCLPIMGCGSGENSTPTSLRNTDNTSGNTAGSSELSTTNSIATQTETSIPTIQRADSSSSSSDSTSSPSTTCEKSQTTTFVINGISSEDLDVYYKGIVLNSKTPLDVLLKKLSFTPVEEDNETTAIRATGQNNDMDYYWYQVLYPDKEHPEIIYDYLYNATKKTGRIVSIDLKNIPTKRGVGIGDTVKQIKNLYGNKFESNYNDETTEYIDFVKNNNTLTFIYEKNSGKIKSVNIDYDSNKAMEEMDITGFGD